MAYMACGIMCCHCLCVANGELYVFVCVYIGKRFDVVQI